VSDWTAVLRQRYSEVLVVGERSVLETTISFSSHFGVYDNVVHLFVLQTSAMSHRTWQAWLRGSHFCPALRFVFALSVPGQ